MQAPVSLAMRHLIRSAESCRVGCLLAIVLVLASMSAGFAAEPAPLLRVSVPGPRNLAYLPIDLIPKIGADRAEGVEVRLQYVGGGSMALQNVLQKNTDFAVAGVPAMLSQQANGEKMHLLATLGNLPVFALMVRADLKNQVRTIADLKGKVIAVTKSSLTSKTTSQQLVELLLKFEGVALDTVRIVPVGQSWDEQFAVLSSGTADAIMAYEPSASRLLARNTVYPLVSMADPGAAKKIPGSGFLLAGLATRPEVVEKEPRKAEKMVAILRRSLQWIAAHTPEQIVSALEIRDAEERAALLAVLRKYKRLYSPDGRLSNKQMKESERFFHQAEDANPLARGVHLEPMVFDKWAGRAE